VHSTLGRSARVVGALALAAVMTLGTVTSASADDPAAIEFESPSVTIAYGEPWVLSFGDNGTISSLDEPNDILSASISDAPSDFAVLVSAYRNQPSDPVQGSVYAAEGNRPLGAGSYDITVTVTPSDPAAEPTTSTATLVVEPAALDIELRAVPDPVRANGEIISASFTGTFASNFYSSDLPESPYTPSGSFTFTVKDDADQVAHTEVVAVDKADDTLGASIYWTGAVAGTNYSATVVFSPNGATSENFSIGAAESASFTGAENPRPQESSTAQPPTQSVQEPPIGPSVPIWLLILILLVIAGLVALVVVQTVRLRRPENTTGEEQ
jgi:hypothetical protein